MHERYEAVTRGMRNLQRYETFMTGTRYETGTGRMRQAKGIQVRYKGYKTFMRGSRWVQKVQDRY